MAKNTINKIGDVNVYGKYPIAKVKTQGLPDFYGTPTRQLMYDSMNAMKSPNTRLSILDKIMRGATKFINPMTDVATGLIDINSEEEMIKKSPYPERYREDIERAKRKALDINRQSDMAPNPYLMHGGKMYFTGGAMMDFNKNNRSEIMGSNLPTVSNKFEEGGMQYMQPRTGQLVQSGIPSQPIAGLQQSNTPQPSGGSGFNSGAVAGGLGLANMGVNAIAKPGSKGAGIASGALSGASAGAALGPYGMAAGAVIGGVAGLLGANKQQKEQADMQAQQERNQYAAGTAGMNPSAHIYSANGGRINSVESPILTTFDGGFKHADGDPLNTNNGIPQGANPDNGKQNIVEKGESKFNNYIFSDKLRIGDVKSYNLGGKLEGKTFSDASKKINTIVKERENDPISKFTTNKLLERLTMANDDAKQFEEFNNQNSELANGPNISVPKNDRFEYGGYIFKNMESKQMADGGEIVSKLWEQKTGTPWAEAKNSGVTTGGLNENLALRKRLISGEFDKPVRSENLVENVDVVAANKITRKPLEYPTISSPPMELQRMYSQTKTMSPSTPPINAPTGSLAKSTPFKEKDNNDVRLIEDLHRSKDYYGTEEMKPYGSRSVKVNLNNSLIPQTVKTIPLQNKPSNKEVIEQKITKNELPVISKKIGEVTNANLPSDVKSVVASKVSNKKFETYKGKYFVLSKENGQIYAFDNNHNLIDSTPAGRGKTIGDKPNLGDTDLTRKVTTADHAYTRAGSGIISEVDNSKADWRDYGTPFNRIKFNDMWKDSEGLGLHGIYKNEYEFRKDIINDPKKLDKLVSWGCINVDKNFLLKQETRPAVGDSIFITKEPLRNLGKLKQYANK